MNLRTCHPELRASCRPADLRLVELLHAARMGRRTLIMGVLNITPDSFSDGGMFMHAEQAVERAGSMIVEGADILDIGGESTRPATFRSGSTIPAKDEKARVLPVINAISQQYPDIPLSIDTYKAEVAEESIAAGASMINDITALRADDRMAAVAAVTGAAICLMHMPGVPGQVETSPGYADVVLDVRQHLIERTVAARAAGIEQDRIVMDPGIGFGKTLNQNLEILRRLQELVVPGYPMLIGTSRKSTIGAVLDNAAPSDRVEGTAATVALAIAKGASIVRVHDVREMARVARMADAIVRGWPSKDSGDRL